MYMPIYTALNAVVVFDICAVWEYIPRAPFSRHKRVREKVTWCIIYTIGSASERYILYIKTCEYTITEKGSEYNTVEHQSWRVINEKKGANTTQHLINDLSMSPSSLLSFLLCIYNKWKCSMSHYIYIYL